MSVSLRDVTLSHSVMFRGVTKRLPFEVFSQRFTELYKKAFPKNTSLNRGKKRKVLGHEAIQNHLKKITEFTDGDLSDCLPGCLVLRTRVSNSICCSWKQAAFACPFCDEYRFLLRRPQICRNIQNHLKKITEFTDEEYEFFFDSGSEKNSWELKSSFCMSILWWIPFLT